MELSDRTHKGEPIIYAVPLSGIASQEAARVPAPGRIRAVALGRIGRRETA